MRGGSKESAIPDFASLHPGYEAVVLNSRSTSATARNR
jgi:hypothetical protein